MRRRSEIRQSAAVSAALLVLLFALPLAVVVPFRSELFSADPTAVESEREPFQPGDLDGEMVLNVLVGDTVEEMTLGEYLVGVVRAEMPASFELEALKAHYPGAHEGEGEGHTIAYTCAGRTGAVTVPNPRMQLAVGTLQTFLDAYLKEHGGEVDYIHGDEVTDQLGSKPGNIGFKLPAMGKEQLFKTVMADGVLPRKTFSMGHAQDKRYYIEARKIVK